MPPGGVHPIGYGVRALPVGKKAALAFLNYPARCADVIAFIQPTTFCKKTHQNRVAKNLHFVREVENPATAFTHESNTVYVPCVLQVGECCPAAERPKHDPARNIRATHT